MEREPPLVFPLVEVREDRRRDIAVQYACKVWRHNDIKKIAAILKVMYEEAYSNGLKDMDRMHQQIDK